MKTKTHPAKRTVKKTANKNGTSKYACEVCGTIIEADPCSCGCDTAVDLVCCGRKMTKKRA